MSQCRFKVGCRDDAAGGGFAVFIKRPACVLSHPIIDQGIARAGVEGDQLTVCSDISYIGYATDIDKRHRQVFCQSAVIGRNQGCTLPARRHIRSAHIVNHLDACCLGQSHTVAQLHREVLFRAVQNGLAVKANNIDI